MLTYLLYTLAVDLTARPSRSFIRRQGSDLPPRRTGRITKLVAFPTLPAVPAPVVPPGAAQWEQSSRRQVRSIKTGRAAPCRRKATLWSPLPEIGRAHV